MEAVTRRALADCLRPLNPIVELAVGRRPEVAAALAETNDVTATDLVERPVPPGVRFVCDDLTAPTVSVYADAAGLYALNLPPELHQPALALAEAVDAALAFTTLGHDAPAAPVRRRETLPGDTLFWIRE